jgi:hypothetical protein
LGDYIRFERFLGGTQYLVPLEVLYEQVLAGWLERGSYGREVITL